jgi:AcrR family transcriptional regulator
MADWRRQRHDDSMTATRTRLTADDRRERMIEAALAIFSERPYEAVSTADLARAAGSTRTNLNYHFGSKRNLYLEALRRFSTFPLGLSHDTADVADNGVERVHKTFDRWLTFVEHHREPYKVLTHARRSVGDDEVVALLDQSLAAWEDRLLMLTGQNVEDNVARARIRAFQAMVGAATEDWLEAGTLSKAAVCDLLTRTLPCLATAQPGPAE